MVRILKVKELDDRKKLLLAQSEMYRETLRLEVANVKFSLALLRRRLDFVKSAVGVVGVAAPVLGLVLGLRGFRKKDVAMTAAKRGMFSKLMAGWQMFRRFRPLVQEFLEGRRAAREARERKNITQFP